MRLITEWWGITIGAENSEEVKILRDLKSRLPENAEHCYDDGYIKFAIGPHAPSEGDNTFDAEVLAYLEIPR